MQNIPLYHYYDAIIASAEKTCQVSATERPGMIIGSLGQKLALILKAVRDDNTTHAELLQRIENICNAEVRP